MRTLGIIILLSFLVITGCGSIPPTPTSVPTSTPSPTAIPRLAYISGEEVQAYDSFIKFYAGDLARCYGSTIHKVLDMWHADGVDSEYPSGVAEYMGDGLWQFQFQLGDRQVFIRSHSFPGDTWEQKCVRVPHPTPSYIFNENDRYYPEPSDEDFDDPPGYSDENLYDGIRGHPDY